MIDLMAFCSDAEGHQFLSAPTHHHVNRIVVPLCLTASWNNGQDTTQKSAPHDSLQIFIKKILSPV